MRIDDLYNCECEDCKKDAIINLAANYNNVDDVIKAGLEALKHLHAQGSYNYKDLDQEPYKNLINQTNSFLNKAVTDNNVTDFMRDAFKNDIFIFSHLRTHAQLQEAGSLLLTDDGKIKSFDRFKLDIAKINGLYNENYLQAEYQFAISSVQMGEKWQNYVESDRYNLQYRTAQDDKVRISHQPLHGITLPMNNPFWDKFYPPNGWRCRCNAVQVRASKYPATNEENALKAGNIATTQIGKDNKNRLEIFRFNPGKQRLVFPPSHPYNKVKNADKVKDKVNSFKFDSEGKNQLKKIGFEIEYEESRGFEVFNKQFSKFNIPLLNKQMDELAKKYNIKVDTKIIEGTHNGINISFFDRKNDVFIVRKLYEDNLKYVKHDYFALPEKLQGKGFSKEMFRIWHQQYLNTKIDKIKVHANLDVGGYTWAKYGFKPYEVKQMAQFFDKAKNLHTNKLISDDEYNDFLNIVEESEDGLLDLNNIANTVYGKKILLESSWFGEIDLNDKHYKSIYETYLFGK